MIVSVHRRLEGQVQQADESSVPLGGPGRGEVQRLAWKRVNSRGADAGERRGVRVKESRTDVVMVVRNAWARGGPRDREGVFRTSGLFPEGRVRFWELTSRKIQLS